MVASTRLGGIFDVPILKKQIAELEQYSAQPDFWNDSANANKVLQRLARMRDALEPFLRLDTREKDIQEFYAILAIEPDDELEADADAQALQFLADLDAYELLTLLSGEHDNRNALMEISAGAGGSEACDWASILFRMYSRWAERKGLKLEVLSETAGDVVGYRNIQFQLTGPYSYGFAKAEAGVHRLVRISPFDAAGRRHTSFAKVEVLPEVDATEVNINPSDLKVETLKAGGAGGQHVNKTESAIRITHVPSGIVVQCQNERSQHKNRAAAMTVLAARLAEVSRLDDEARLNALKGATGPAEWGRQIRSYVMQPYTMVKDLHTRHESGNVQGILDGEIDGFIEAYLKKPPGEDGYFDED